MTAARTIAVWVILLASAALALYGWPTPYAVAPANGLTLRTNRVTGCVSTLTLAGWKDTDDSDECRAGVFDRWCGSRQPIPPIPILPTVARCFAPYSVTPSFHAELVRQGLLAPLDGNLAEAIFHSGHLKAFRLAMSSEEIRWLLCEMEANRARQAAAERHEAIEATRATAVAANAQREHCVTSMERRTVLAVAAGLLPLAFVVVLAIGKTRRKGSP